VRINGNRVIRVEVAKVGYPPKIYTKDEVAGLMRTDGTPLETEKPKEHTLQLGDVRRDPDTQSPAAAPTLAKPGEKLDIPEEQQQSQKVRFPKPHDADGTASPTTTTPAPTTTPSTTPTPDTTQPAAEGEDQKPHYFLGGKN
jgi:cell division septation protein DedD